ncbi:MAG: hypothetical protein JSS30_07180 [Verrucomicrobia bacterium]|nr:hypothetical protein [Verrucomicrobiota bacterium]
MKNKLRHMKKYSPRRRRSNKAIQKRQLKDFEHLLDMDLGCFLILAEEGTPKQIGQARAKIRSNLLRYGSDMEAIGRDLGEGFPEYIRNYLKTMNQIVQNSSSKIDPEVLNQYRKQSLTLRQKAA